MQAVWGIWSCYHATPWAAGEEETESVYLYFVFRRWLCTTYLLGNTE